MQLQTTITFANNGGTQNLDFIISLDICPSTFGAANADVQLSQGAGSYGVAGITTTYQSKLQYTSQSSSCNNCSKCTWSTIEVTDDATSLAPDSNIFDVVIGDPLTDTVITVREGISEALAGSYTLSIKEIDPMDSNINVVSAVKVTIEEITACTPAAISASTGVIDNESILAVVGQSTT